MTLAISKTNPFLRAQKAEAVNPFKAQQESNNVQEAKATNPIKTMDPAKADEQLKSWSAAMTSYGMAQVAMQNGGMIGTETTGTTG